MNLLKSFTSKSIIKKVVIVGGTAIGLAIVSKLLTRNTTDDVIETTDGKTANEATDSAE